MGVWETLIGKKRSEKLSVKEEIEKSYERYRLRDSEAMTASEMQRHIAEAQRKFQLEMERKVRMAAMGGMPPHPEPAWAVASSRSSLEDVALKEFGGKLQKQIDDLREAVGVEMREMRSRVDDLERANGVLRAMLEALMTKERSDG